MIRRLTTSWYWPSLAETDIQVYVLGALSLEEIIPVQGRRQGGGGGGGGGGQGGR